MSTKPRVQALLLAEHVYTDVPTGKRIVAGTFNTINVRAFPIDVALPAQVYISMTDIRQGRANLELRFVDTADLSVLMTARFPVTAKDVHDTVEIAIPLPGFPLPHEGVYDLELHADGERLGSHRITARLSPQQS